MVIKVSMSREDFIEKMNEFANFDAEEYLDSVGDREEVSSNIEGMILLTFIKYTTFDYNPETGKVSLLIDIPQPMIHLE
jgi:hypothetical protein